MRLKRFDIMQRTISIFRKWATPFYSNNEKLLIHWHHRLLPHFVSFLNGISCWSMYLDDFSLLTFGKQFLLFCNRGNSYMFAVLSNILHNVIISNEIFIKIYHICSFLLLEMLQIKAKQWSTHAIETKHNLSNGPSIHPVLDFKWILFKFSLKLPYIKFLGDPLAVKVSTDRKSLEWIP